MIGSCRNSVEPQLFKWPSVALDTRGEKTSMDDKQLARLRQKKAPRLDEISRRPPFLAHRSACTRPTLMRNRYFDSLVALCAYKECLSKSLRMGAPAVLGARCRRRHFKEGKLWGRRRLHAYAVWLHPSDSLQASAIAPYSLRK